MSKRSRAAAQAAARQAKEEQASLQDMKNNVDSNEYIEDIAREKLGMYLPNERVYIDAGK